MNPHRRQIVQDAILQMRATRQAWGPEVVARLQLLVREFDPAVLGSLAAAPEHPASAQDVDAQTQDNPDMVMFDHKNNLTVIMKFLQIKQGSREFQEQVRLILAEHAIH